jgi:succinyl-CoA synthetase beta subunit
MQLLEHQAKEWAQAVGLAVPNGHLARSPDEAVAAAAGLSQRVVVKAQVPIGGRSKAGGIVVTDQQEVAPVASRLIGSEIAGYRVDTLLIEEYVAAKYELYLAVTIDPRTASPLLLLGARGGIDVDEHAVEVARVSVPLFLGVRSWHLWQAATIAGVAPDLMAMLWRVSRAMFRLFVECRAELVEINPLIVTATGDGVAADVRIVIEGREEAETTPMSRAGQGFDFVELDPQGAVGLITTGAGASMVLVDLLKDAGVRPINFCDIRSGSFRGSPERLVAVLRVLNSYPNLVCVAVNIFAGITDLKEFADLLVVALRKEPPAVPTIVRLEGPDAGAARVRIRNAGLPWAAGLEELIQQVHGVVFGAAPLQAQIDER